MKKQQTDLPLLPNYVKKIGFGLLLISVLLLTAYLLKVLPIEKTFSGLLIKNSILTGLLLLALSKDKIEDELTLKLRVQSFAISFIYAVLFIITHPLIQLLFKPVNLDYQGEFPLVLSMFSFYFISFYMAKRKC